MTDHLYAIGVGSNIEPRLEYMMRALAELDHPLGTCQVVATSRLYESKGWGRDDLSPFLNAVLVLRSAEGPEAVLTRCRRIENDCLRQREVKWGPRTLDLDVLACDELRRDTPELQLPHPWAHRRPFVYLPWREVVSVFPSWNELISEPPAEVVGEEADSVPTKMGAPAWGGEAPEGVVAEVRCADEEATERLAESLGRSVLAGDLIAAEGRMGAGKTIFARGVARGLAIQGPIQSPTYTVSREYGSGRALLAHWDLYRLGSEDDLASCAYEYPRRDAVTLVEWASRFPHAVGTPAYRVELVVHDDDSRTIVIRAERGRLPWIVRAQAHAMGGTIRW